MRIGAVTLLSLLVVAVPGFSWGQVTALHFGHAWLGPGRVVNDAVIVVNGTRSSLSVESCLIAGTVASVISGSDRGPMM